MEDQRTAGKQKSMWSWKVYEPDLKYQLENYNKLKISESYRGMAILIVAILIGFATFSYFSGYVNLTALLWSFVIYLPTMYFVFKGHRWAIILFMVIWGLGGIYQLGTIGKEGNSLLTIFIWIVVFPYFWKALRVENERIKLTHAPKKSTDPLFCHKCGKRLEKDSKFCQKCGAKVI